MTEKRVALLIISINSLLVWDLLVSRNILVGKMQTVLVILSLIPFLYTAFQLINDFKLESSYFKFIMTLFLLYEAVIIVRGLSFQYADIKNYIQNGIVFWPFVVPFFIFFEKKLSTIGLFIKWIYFSGLFFLAISLMVPTLLLDRSTAETFIGFSVPCGFLLLNSSYLSSKKVNLAFLAIFISIISMILLARRTGLVIFLGFVITGYLLNRSTNSNSKLFKFLPFFIIITVFFLFNQHFEHYKDLLFDKLVGRISEDTRTDLFTMFFSDMRHHFIFGKGMNASYYFPLGGFEIDGVYYGRVEYRYLIENGYLQLMLTGGIVYIVLYVLVLLPAAILGFFKSSNLFVKACGIVIFLRLIDMFLYGLPALNLAYILVWICVGICYKESMRRLSNDEIMSEFKKIGLK